MSNKLGYYNMYDINGKPLPKDLIEQDIYLKEMYHRALALGDLSILPSITLTESGFRLDKVSDMLIQDNILYIPEGTAIIGREACKDLINIESVVFNKELIHISGQAFEGCSNLKSAVLYDGLLEIAPYAFKGTNIKCLDIPGTVKVVKFDSLNDVLLELKLNYGTKKLILNHYSHYKEIQKIWIPPTISHLDIRYMKSLVEIHIFDGLNDILYNKDVKIIKEGSWGNWKQYKKEELEKELSKLYQRRDRLLKVKDDIIKDFNIQIQLEKIEESILHTEIELRKC